MNDQEQRFISEYIKIRIRHLNLMISSGNLSEQEIKNELKYCCCKNNTNLKPVKQNLFLFIREQLKTNLDLLTKHKVRLCEECGVEIQMHWFLRELTVSVCNYCSPYKKEHFS